MPLPGDPYPPINEFITTKFKKRTCKKFISPNSWSSTCGCGYDGRYHKQDTEPSTEETTETTETWEIQSHTETSATDAFGEVNFDYYGDKRAKYVRVDYETEISDLVKLLLDYWKMKTPRLLISVAGGDQDFTLKPRLEKVFCQGLVKAAESMHTWIITGGTSTGVTKYVGKVLRDYTTKCGGKKQLVALGIATWGCIKNRYDLIPNEVKFDKSKGSNGCWPASYKATDSWFKFKESPLDPNHTHFILVDNGTQRQLGVEVELRARLENEISKKVSAEESISIPVVCVALGGGPGTLKTVKEAVENGTPVVIVKDSGGAAAVLAFAYGKWQQQKGQRRSVTHQKGLRRSEDTASQDHWWYEVESEIREKFRGSNFDIVAVKKDVDYVCEKKSDLLSIFELESGSSARDIDFAILNAVFKVNCGIDQLRLALTLDRIDAAKDKIFIDGVNFEKSQLDELMVFAIQNNRVAFVQLFLEKGMRTFFKTERFKDLCKELKTTKQKEIESLRKDLGVKLLVYDHPEEDPPLILFIWSVLTMRRDMALVFLSERHEYLALVVAAHLISRTLLRKDRDSGFGPLNKELSEQVTFYQELAVGLLNECHSSDPLKLIQLLVRNIPAFGKTTVLKMAVQADNINFKAHPACQHILTEDWTGKLSDDNNYVKLLIAIVCPFVAPVLLKFRDNSTFRSVSATDDSRVTWIKDKCAVYIKMLSNFFQAPEIKFSYNFLSHLAFLLLYGIILLTDFYPKIGTKEIILIVWVGTLVTEEIRQIMTNNEHGIRQKLYKYITDVWNIMDVITIVTFLTGMILRFVPVSTCGQCFYAARIILALNFMAFFFRILHVFSIHRELGPKLVMIGKMMIDLFYFMIILLVFIAAYGIASHVILYPNQPLNIALARDVLSRSWWNIFGELGIDEVSGEACDNRTVMPYAEQCASMDADEFSSYGCADYKEDKCPSIDWFVPIILAIYVLIVNVLMTSLLIAMFSNTFSDIQGQTEVVWNLQRYHLIIDYKSRPMLPPPLIILAHVYRFVLYCKRQKKTRSFKSALSEEKEKEEEKKLLDWETLTAEEYLRKRKPDDQQEPDFNDKSDLIVDKLEEMSIILSHQGKKMNSLKQKMMEKSEYSELLHCMIEKSEDSELLHSVKHNGHGKERDSNDKLDLIVDKLEEISNRLTQLEKQVNTPKEEVKMISNKLSDCECPPHLTEGPYENVFL